MQRGALLAHRQLQLQVQQLCVFSRESNGDALPM